MDEATRDRANTDVEYLAEQEDKLALDVGRAALHAARQTTSTDPPYDGFGVDRTVLDRALNGRDMAALALTGSCYMAFEDYEAGLTDALANLMHFARRYDIDFGERLAMAERHHAEESRLDWAETPA